MLRRAFLQHSLTAPILATAWRSSPPRAFLANIGEMMQVAPVPGAVIGAVINAKPAWVEPIGVRNLETGGPILPDTIFQAASLSKQACAYAALLLEKQGKLNLDATLVSYVDDLPNEQARAVTVRQVLSHSTGFPNWRFEAGSPLVPEFTPGSKFQYSGEGYFYLQRILENITGLGYGALMRKLVFEPLGMTSTSMLWQPEWSARYAHPHGRRGNLRRRWEGQARRLHEAAQQKNTTADAFRYDDYSAALADDGKVPLPNNLLPNAAASMITCAPDYARFLAAAIFNPAIAREQVRINSALGWGLGWGIERVAGREYLWQWGDNGGFKNFVAAEPATGSAIFVFTNGDSGAHIYDRVITAATGHDHPALFWV